MLQEKLNFHVDRLSRAKLPSRSGRSLAQDSAYDLVKRGCRPYYTCHAGSMSRWLTGCAAIIQRP